MKLLASLSVGIWSVLLTFAPGAHASQFPARPVTFIVGYAPGGGTDIVARSVADVLSRKWGQQVIVRNRPGGTGVIGIRDLKAAAPDGYTLGIWTDSDVGNAAVRDDLDYDLVKDFDHISQLAAGGTVLVVNPSLPVKSFSEFVTYAKQNPGKVNFAVVAGGGMHLDSLRIEAAAGIKNAIIGYASTGPALTDVVAGHSDALVLPLGAALPFIKSHGVRILAVGSAKRWPGLPDVPTLSESIPGLESTFFYGVVGPKGMPEQLKTEINAAVQEVLQDPALGSKFESMGFIPTGNSPSEFKEVIAAKLNASRIAAEQTGLKQSLQQKK
ncbi:Bug family tripartite tricarboxylate transporter substrate binding protein [Bordetella tumulicola]|uniref:Bug family tripartite tricarboxylate transporter substrate binding protein n=1 Tax=Bordetella tumulicola TaxID=1649133 RepID=UPI0039EF836C